MSNSVTDRSLLFRVQKFFHRKFPTVIPDPSLNERLEIYRKRDEEDNAKSEPPSDEVIDLLCIWAIELYTPSQISELLHCFDRLGWNTGDFSGGYHNPARWIQKIRESSHGGAWLNLGTIRRPGEGNNLYFDRQAPLPPGIKYAFASMYSVTSSITCVVVTFIFDESQNNRFETVLRRKRQTNIIPDRGNRYAIIRPQSQKSADIREIRSEMRKLVSNWFRSHLPGLFASGNLKGEYPTCEFFTLNDSFPCPSTSNHNDANTIWLRILDIHDDYAAWQSDSLNGLKFVWPLASERDVSNHAAMVARVEDFTDEILQTYGGKNRYSLVNYVNDSVGDLLSRWAIVGMLTGYVRYLNTIRDSFMFDPKHRTMPVQLLEDLSSHLSQSVDIGAVTNELKEMAEKNWLFERGTNDFYACYHPMTQVDKTMLKKALETHIREQSEWIHNIDRFFRDIFIQYGAALGTRENIKLQKRINRLTWVIVLLTIMIMFLTTITTLTSIETGNLLWLTPDLPKATLP